MLFRSISGGYAATAAVLFSTTYANAFELDTETPAEDLLEMEQASIVYDNE